MDCGSKVRLGLFVLLAVGCISVHGYYLQDEDKRQDLVPFPRVGRQALVPFPRVGKRQGLIPFPRIGRAYDDIDELMAADSDDDVTYFLVPYKRNPMAFTPRIGRKKRSTNDDEANETDDRMPHPWQLADWAEMERVLRQLIPAPRVGREESKRAGASFTPRIGRAPFTPRIGRRSDPTLNVRAAFTPRIGRGNA